MSKRIALGLCALGLALLAGCTIYAGEPEPPPAPPAEPPPAPPANPPPEPPANPPPEPPDEPPPPMEANLPGDEYEPANHRLLVSDCPNNALLAVDLATGERSVLIDRWPWTEPDSEICVEQLVADRDGTRAFAIVSRVFPDPVNCPGAHIQSNDLAALDLETREVTPLQNIEYRCCSDDCHVERYFSPQLDEYHGRLLYIEWEGLPDNSPRYVSGTPFGTAQGEQLHPLYTSTCHPDNDLCAGEPWTEAELLTFDPAAPDQRILVLSRRYPIGDYFDGEYLVDRLDVATGALTESLRLELVDGDPSTGYLRDVSIDTEKQRALITWGSMEQWMVFALDLVTGEEAVLYDGSPTAGGAQLACEPNPAYDSRERRLLLAEPIGAGQDCKNGVFAVDVDTGEFTQIVDRID